MRTLLALLVAVLVVGGTVWVVADDGSMPPTGAAPGGSGTGNATDEGSDGADAPAPTDSGTAAPPEPFRPVTGDGAPTAGGPSTTDDPSTGNGGVTADGTGEGTAGDDTGGDGVPDADAPGSGTGDGAPDPAPSVDADRPGAPGEPDTPGDPEPSEPATPSGSSGSPAPSAPAVPDQPGSRPTSDADGPDAADTLGWEAGYRYDAVLDVDERDGLSEAELDAVVARTMARLELLRGLEFLEPVTVDVISREQHLREGIGVSASAEPDPLNEQVWEALFVVGEDRTVNEEFATLYGSNVLGYYAPSEKRLVVISADPDRAVVDPHTLAHELVHALQDQHYDLAASAASVHTQDAQLARNGLIEGEANYLAELYVERCVTEWDCLERPRGGPTGGGDANLPLLLIVFQPYSDGPVYVDALVAAGGWAAVDAAHESLPATTETIIHSDVAGTDRTADAVPIPETARNGWARVGDPAGDTLGEASIYVMFWNQATENRVDVLDDRAFLDPDGDPRFDVYNYSAPVSDGWAGDRLVAYERNGSAGYVWATEWDSAGDAAEFAAAYRAVLEEGYDAETVAPDTYVVERGPYADAFRVTLDGTRVVVVNAPTAADLADVHSPTRDAGDGDTSVRAVAGVPRPA